ncbi:MAG TPA: hypothetical protein PLZ44_00950, partial [Methanothrix sp.]|nr:hypothetical protein [Methanothrix sp.]
MQVIGRSNTANPAYDVFVSGGRAYITEGTDGIEVVDSSSGAHLGSCTGWPSSHFAMGIYASGSYAYVGTSDGYLVVLNLVNPNSPIIANTIVTHGPVGSGGGLCVYSNNIYLATDAGVEVYSLGNPSSPSYSTT